jgi:hypothetical protein
VRHSYRRLLAVLSLPLVLPVGFSTYDPGPPPCTPFTLVPC